MMRVVSQQLGRNDQLTAPKATPHPQKVSIGSGNPMMVTLGDATIVYDPDHLQ
ncbi:MAG: hypothetical protein GZ094_17390 [Mariniphaga sp.]|nr:hypothetical protein [Mariniphaga sp.]